MAHVPYQPNQKDGPIFDDITATLTNSLGIWYGEGSSLEPIPPEVRSYRNCFILRYPLTDSAGETKTILVKIRRNPKMDSLWQAVHADLHANIPNEYRSLAFVYEALENPSDDFAVIRPLTYLERYHAIVMEEYPSRTLRQVLVQRRSSPNGTGRSELLDAATKTGKWLHYFHHQVHAPVETPYTTYDILQVVDNYATRLHRDSRGRVDARSILDSFSRKLEAVQIESLLFSQSHADMTCDNVLYSYDRKVCIIDIKTRPAAIYSDLGLILTHPETFKQQIFSRGAYLPESILREYRLAILAGYFGDQEVDEFFVQLYSAIKVLDKWAMYEELMSRYTGIKHLLAYPIGPFVTSYFQTVLQKHLGFLQTTEVKQAFRAARIIDRAA